MSQDYDEQILEALRGPGAYCTGDVARNCNPLFGHNNRTHTAFIRQRLLTLQRAGLVKPLDDLKPVCWVRVE